MYEIFFIKCCLGNGYIMILLQDKSVCFVLIHYMQILKLESLTFFSFFRNQVPISYKFCLTYEPASHRRLKQIRLTNIQ